MPIKANRIKLTTNNMLLGGSNGRGSETTTPGFPRSAVSTALASKVMMIPSGTIATTSTTDTYVIAPEDGTLTSIDFYGLDALAANDTNYITFSVTNLGQSNGGSTAMLSAVDANTTKATGGSAIAAHTKRSLTLHGTAGNLSVVQGDLLRIRATATGTLANTVTLPKYCVRFGGTT